MAKTKSIITGNLRKMVYEIVKDRRELLEELKRLVNACKHYESFGAIGYHVDLANSLINRIEGKDDERGV